MRPVPPCTVVGLENRWGKLPVTIYPGNYSQMQPIQQMSLTSGPGRPPPGGEHAARRSPGPAFNPHRGTTWRPPDCIYLSKA